MRAKNGMQLEYLTPTSFNSGHFYLLYSWRSSTTLKNGHENSASQKRSHFLAELPGGGQFQRIVCPCWGKIPKPCLFCLFSGEFPRHPNVF